MSNENAELIQCAYQAYAKGDLDPMLELVDPATVGAGTIVPTACSRCARDGSLPCATAAIARRPCSLPGSRREQPPVAALGAYGDARWPWRCPQPIQL